MGRKTKTVKEENTEAKIIPMPQVIKKPTIMAKEKTVLRSRPNLEKQYESGFMRMGTAYQIEKEVRNGYGNFYLLNNGKYIVKDGRYIIK